MQVDVPDESPKDEAVLDLTGEPAAESSWELTTRPSDLRKQRENVRGRLAAGLLLLLAVVLVLPICGVVCFDLEVAHATALIEKALPPLVALVGAATGFYYGATER